MMTEPTIIELMDLLQKSFVPHAAGDTRALVFFHLTGDQGGDWIARIENKECKVEQNTPSYFDLKLDANAQDIIDLFMGRLEPMRAFFSGRLKMQGDQRLAFQLASFFKIPNRD
jgi:putative sterol carrier protein